MPKARIYTHITCIPEERKLSASLINYHISIDINHCGKAVHQYSF